MPYSAPKMSRAVTVARGRALSTMSAERPDPAPASSTRPSPPGRNCAVGSTSGRLKRSTRLTMIAPATAQTASAAATAPARRQRARYSTTATTMQTIAAMAWPHVHGHSYPKS
jgi:hypothetical protein